MWDDHVTPDPPPTVTSYPDYDWRTEGRIKEYWQMYRGNNNIAGYITESLIAAHEVYTQYRYLNAVKPAGRLSAAGSDAPAPARLSSAIQLRHASHLGATV